MMRRATSVLYKYMAKPVLFRFAPDTVHTRMMQLGGFVQRYRFLLVLNRVFWAYRHSMLQQKVGGVTFENPVGLSAGFDKNIELPPLMKAIGFGFMTGGSVTAKPCAGNVRPWFYRIPSAKSIAVNAGLGNEGSEAIAKRVKRYDASMFTDFPLFVSAAPTNDKSLSTVDEAIDDYIQTIRCMRKLAQCIEINISCPNTYAGEPFTSPRGLQKLLAAIDDLHLKQPVFIKMPHDVAWLEFKKLLEVIVRHNVTGVTVSNLRKDRTGIDIPAAVKGGLSGKPTWRKSNELIAATYQLYGDRLMIIGVGGIFNAEDAYTKIRLGASLVALVTGLIYEGPQVVGDINYGLTKLLRRDGYANVAQAVGADVKKSTIE